MTSSLQASEAPVVLVGASGAVVVGVGGLVVEAGDGEVVALVEAVAPSSAEDLGGSAPDRNQAHPPAIPTPTSPISIARKLRRLTPVSLTSGTVAVGRQTASIPFIRPVGLGLLPLGRSRVDRPNSAGSLQESAEDQAVFVYYFAQLHRPFDKVEDQVCRLLKDLTGWADAAYRDGEELRARVGVGGRRPFIAKTVTLAAGRPVRSPDQTTIPLAWKATGAPGLFPQMNADLTVARLGPEMTRLGFSGSYEAPGGSVGQAIDEALLHRIAESSVKGFVDRIAEAVGNGVGQAIG
jgi:hypothetical protein